MSYVKTLACVTLVLVVAIVGVTAWLDPYGDLYYLTGLGGGPPPSTNNYGERKYKARLIRALPRDSVRFLVFGNSRSAAIDVGAGLPGHPGTGVNMAFGGAGLDQILAFMATARRFQPDAIPLVGLDYAQCLEPPSADRLYLGRLWDARSLFDALQRLFSLRTFWVGIQVRRDPRAYSETELMPFGNIVRHLDYGNRAEINPRIAADLKVYGAFFRSATYTERCVGAVRALRRAFPKAVLFVNPLSRPMADLLRATGHGAQRREWVETLRRDGPVIDFNCAARITDRAANYADAHHYSRAVGALILADIGRFLDHGKPEYGCLR